MNKKSIITILLTLIAVTGQAIDEYQFHSGTAVLKGRILNKPADDWNIISVNACDLFTGKELVYTIPVAADGTFEGSIHLPHSQSVLVEDVEHVFLAVGDTVEVTKDAAQDEYEGVTIGGHGTSLVTCHLSLTTIWSNKHPGFFSFKCLAGTKKSRENLSKLTFSRDFL